MRNRLFPANHRKEQDILNQGTYSKIGNINGPYEGPYPLCENLQRKISAMLALRNNALIAGTLNGEIFLIAEGKTTPLGIIHDTSPGGGNLTCEITAFTLLPNNKLAISSKRGDVFEFNHPLLEQTLQSYPRYYI